MAFTFSEEYVASYRKNGFTIFPNILPGTLIKALRKASDQARLIARQIGGGQVQRLQPVAENDIDQRAFFDYAELPELNDAIQKTLTPNHYHGDPNVLGILLEPRDLPWCTTWHRDWRDKSPSLPIEEWDAVFSDIRYLNQVNCALHDDHCLWVVPGSHLRGDLPSETERFPQRPIRTPDLRELAPRERELACLAYCRSMPGATQIMLTAGDFLLYRNSLWHVGCYTPHAKRATLHDSVLTPEFKNWMSQMNELIRKRQDPAVDTGDSQHIF